MLSSPRASRTREQLSNQLRAGSVVIVYFPKQPISPNFLNHFFTFLCSYSALIYMFTIPPLPADAAIGSVDIRKGEYRAAAQGALHAFAGLLGMAAGESMSADVRKGAMSAIKQVPEVPAWLQF